MTTLTTNTLTGKVALVTGGSRGIGAAEAVGGRALALHADSANVDAVKGAVTETVKVFGGIHILVNNAGLSNLKTYDQFAMEEFDQMIAVNVRAIFAAVQTAAPQMSKGGRIINIGSITLIPIRFQAIAFMLCQKQQ